MSRTEAEHLVEGRGQADWRGQRQRAKGGSRVEGGHEEWTCRRVGAMVKGAKAKARPATERKAMRERLALIIIQEHLSSVKEMSITILVGHMALVFTA